MATADSLVDAANAAFTDASTRATDAINASNAGISAANSAVSGLYVDYTTGIATLPDVTPTDLGAPTLPTMDFSSEVKDAFDHAFGSFNESLKPQILDYLDEFFPDIAASIKTGSDEWIVSALADGRAVPVDVENALWNRTRDREVQDGLRTEQSIVEAAAARGFSMPPGTMAYAVAANQQDTQKRLSALNRDIAIKAFDVANDNSKFAVQAAIGLRSTFVGALSDFIKTAMVQPSQAADYAKTILTAKTALYDTAVRIYSANIAEEEMRTGVLHKNQAIELQSTDLWYRARDNMTDAQIKIAQVKANAAMAQAAMMAEVAGKALATRNTMISASAGV